MKNTLLLLSTALLLTFTPMFAKANSVILKADVTNGTAGDRKITLVEIQDYMAQYQIEIVGYSTITGSENLYARDTRGNTYVVYVQAGYIGGFSEVDY
jgi:hypothetical protein